MRFTWLFFCFLFFGNMLYSQSVPVSKTYSKGVYMHYMSWFEAPSQSGYWGWHWTMNNMDPNVIDPATGLRQIASHFYPKIGPYDSADPDVIEYHLLLMKYCGIDGVLIDWYGVDGTNSDIQNLLDNANALINQTQKFGLSFGLVLEDRFAASISDVQNNISYAAQNYFSQPNYIRTGVSNEPLLGVFGPITYQQESDWGQILPRAGENVQFLTLWNESGDAGMYADGEYAWIYEDETKDNYLTLLENFYANRAPSLNRVLGVAYPGFEDFYAEGNAGAGYFTIPRNGGQTLQNTLALAEQYSDNIDMLQLATWNDFGEGTVFEPTMEFGFDYLVALQDFLGVPFGKSELETVYRLYRLRKENAGNQSVQNLLDQASDYLNGLQVDQAIAIMDDIENVSTYLNGTNSVEGLTLFPNPADRLLLLKRDAQDLSVFSIVDMAGNVIKEVESEGQSIAIDLTTLLPGAYFLIEENHGEIRNLNKFFKI